MNPRDPLDKISEASSPAASSKGASSPLRGARNRVMINSMGEPYLSFFKIDTKNEQSQYSSIKVGKKSVTEPGTLAEKDKKIQSLQETIMREMVKKNARERAFEHRVNGEHAPHIPQIFAQLVRRCVDFSAASIELKRKALRVVYQSSRATKEKRVKLVVEWVLEWVRAVFLGLAQQIKKLI